MERHANYGLIGGLTIGLLAAAFAFVFWLGQAQFASSFDEYRIIFTGPVRGLSEGSEVQFNGIKVGEITKIRLDPRNPNRVLTDVRVTDGTPVRVDSTAATESQGITGVSYIQITAGTPSRPLLKERSSDPMPVIRAEDSSMQALLEGGGELVARASEALRRINSTLSDDNIANVSLAIADVRATTAELRSRRAMFARAESMFDRLDRAARDIESAAESAEAAIDGDGRRAFSDMSQAAQDLRGTVAEAREAIGKINVAAGTLAGDQGTGIGETLESIDAAARSLETLTREIRQSPRELISRPASREREIPR
jgi:phospholipid/cholesterol/gamma-HCH transport system substrate-binding protein